MLCSFKSGMMHTYDNSDRGRTHRGRRVEREDCLSAFGPSRLLIFLHADGREASFPLRGFPLQHLRELLR